MEKTIIDESTGWEYELIGDQYYPTGRRMKNGHLQPETVDADNGSEEQYIGLWAQRHLKYIKQHMKSLYFELYVSGQLNGYLAEIETQAEDLFFRVVKEMAVLEGITEKNKAEDQMEWVQRMNNVYFRAREVVNQEIIFH
ncbi:MAG: TnpV protein [Clostridia bacterium]|nr:TnpV protein [Clostridia bacterium]